MTDGFCLNCGADNSEEWARAQDVEYRTSHDDFVYRRCFECGVLYLTDPPIDRLDQIYPPTYYSYGAEDGGAVSSVKSWLDRRTFGRLLRRIPGESLRLLDIGGGTGVQANAARAADSRITRSVIVDLDERCRATAEEHGHEFVCSRVEDFKASEPFDLVLLLNLIEHVDNPRAVLRAIGDMVSDRGRILVKTPNHRSLDARLYRHRSWGGYHCPRHWVIFDEKSFRDAANAAGLTVTRLRLTQGASFWTVSLLAQLEKKGRVRRPASGSLHDHRFFGPIAGAFAAFDFVRRPLAPTSQMFVELQRS